LRIAVANSASELVAAIGALAGGLLAMALGQAPVIWIAVACQAVAFGLIWVGVKEPRRR
jgi:predicted MFS family arabinose efflux permease